MHLKEYVQPAGVGPIKIQKPFAGVVGWRGFAMKKAFAYSDRNCILLTHHSCVIQLTVWRCAKNCIKASSNYGGHDLEVCHKFSRWIRVYGNNFFELGPGFVAKLCFYSTFFHNMASPIFHFR